METNIYVSRTVQKAVVWTLFSGLFGSYDKMSFKLSNIRGEETSLSVIVEVAKGDYEHGMVKVVDDGRPLCEMSYTTSDKNPQPVIDAAIRLITHVEAYLQ